MYKRDYTFRMNVMQEIFEIRSCIEILANDIKVNTADEYMLYKDGWMDGWLGFNGILSTQVAAISCLRKFKVY